ncbi:MAG: alpha/beta fold hydrolase [Sandaracinaceae bacterium]
MEITVGRHTMRAHERGSGEPVVLIHSTGMSSRQWRRTAEALEGDYRAILPDLIGYGESSRFAPGEYIHFTVDQLALQALIDEVGPCHLVGHSYGGFLALLAALQRPHGVKSVAVYEPVAFGVLRSTRDAEALATLDVASEHENPTTEDERERWLARFIEYWNGPGAWETLPAPLKQDMRDAAPKVIGEVTTLGEDRTPHTAYETLTIPTLLLGGADTTLAAKRVLDALERAIPKTTRHAIEGASHMGPLTHGAEVTARIVEHLART